MQKKVKIAIVVALAAIMTASVAYAWIASNTLHFVTTLSGSPFSLTILDNYSARNVQNPPYLTNPIYYEQPDVLYTNTKNLASVTYNNVYTNYKIYRTDLVAMQTGWVTVNIIDAAHPSPGLDLPLTVDGLGNLVYSIGPYTAVGGFSADATVTVTFHIGAPLVEYQADVWVSVS